MELSAGLNAAYSTVQNTELVKRVVQSSMILATSKIYCSLPVLKSPSKVKSQSLFWGKTTSAQIFRHDNQNPRIISMFCAQSNYRYSEKITVYACLVF